ncbi:MAG: nucleotide disphospho-sugar-binding domain-containing protein, partial [Oscillospiraceae bacterium]
VIPIGFMENKTSHYNDFPKEVNDVLESNEKVILISGGTSNMVSSNFYKIAANACARAGYKGILVTKYDELVPNPLPEGVIRAKNLNLSYLMTKVDAIIHHGGMGTLNESIAAGIPQIILPHLTDGPDNAYRLQKLGIAKLFPISRWNVFDIALCLQKSVENENENIVLYSNKLKEQHIRQDVVNVIEEMIGSPNYIVNNLAHNSICNEPHTYTPNKMGLDKLSKLTDEQKKYLLSKLKQPSV